MSVQLLDDAQLVHAGLAMMLRPFADQVTLVSGCGSTSAQADVVLVDCVVTGDHRDRALVCRPAPVGAGRTVVAYTWEVNRELVEGTQSWGYRGYLSKALPARALVDALERVFAGELVVAPCLDGRLHPPCQVLGVGSDVGLTPREAEVLALVSAGVSNKAIADLLFISLNSVKSYVRTAYRKIGVTTRPQAVLWGVRHGLQPWADAPSEVEGRT